uniref:Uncharacterized protein n=1 Tax=Arundo donax TaxID=35708 RepID=A0A0A9GMR5_ARUDO
MEFNRGEKICKCVLQWNPDRTPPSA